MQSISRIENRLHNLRSTDELGVISSLVELEKHLTVLDTPEDGQVISRRLLQSNIPILLCAALRQDLSKVPGGWNQAIRLSNLLTTILPPPGTWSLYMSEDLLTQMIESLLIVLRRIQKNLITLRMKSMQNKGGDATTLSELQRVFTKVFHQMVDLAVNRSEVAERLLNSPWFLQLFIIDDRQFITPLNQLLVKCVEKHSDAVGSMKEMQKINILDELIYHFAVLDSLSTVDGTICCLLALLSSDEKLRSFVANRYRGIHLLVSRWMAHCNSEFGASEATSSPILVTKQLLLQLMGMIGLVEFSPSKQIQPEQATSSVNAEPRFSEPEAALVIQSAWRGHVSRKRMRKINRGMMLFQKQFRERINQQSKKSREERIQTEFDHFVKSNRRRRWREKLESELALLSSLPPPIVCQEEQRRQTEAATKIQAGFRGHLVRESLHNQADQIERHKAARIIQESYRRHLSRMDCLELRRQKVNPELRTELTTEKLEAVKADEVRRVNFTRTALDARLLLAEPCATDPNSGAIDKANTTTLARSVDSHRPKPGLPPKLDALVCRSQPLARLARQQHRDRMACMGKAWWTLAMRRLVEGQNQWFEANESLDRLDQTDSVGSQDGEIEKWAKWLPDDAFDGFDEECVQDMEHCLEA